MLDDKKQAKLDLVVEIAGPAGPLVSFSGSYVVQYAAEPVVTASTHLPATWLGANLAVDRRRKPTSGATLAAVNLAATDLVTLWPRA